MTSKIRLLSTITLFFCLNIYAQNKINVKNFVPPGTIKINDSLFIDNTPITNIMYDEFEMRVSLGWNLKTKDLIKKMPNYGIDIKKLINFPNTKVDSSLFNKIKRNKIDTINDKLVAYSYHHKYCSNPVINVSKENAEMYCLWRTDMVELAMASKSKTVEERKELPNKVTYRLPTKEELITIENYFKNKDKIKIIKKNSPTKIEIQKVKDVYYKINLPEISADEEKKRNNATFRCVCEVSK
jgi:hypothetical protein